MAAPEVIATQKAIALKEAIDTVAELLPEPSVRLDAAQNDFAAKTDPEFMLAALGSELANVVADLAARVEKLENSKRR
jgi:hypothetical protein